MAFVPVPGTSVIFETGPGALAHTARMDALGLTPAWTERAQASCAAPVPVIGLRPLRKRAASPIVGDEGLARASASPTWSGPEGSSHNEPRLGRCPTSHPPTLSGRAQNTPRPDAFSRGAIVRPKAAPRRRAACDRSGISWNRGWPGRIADRRGCLFKRPCQAVRDMDTERPAGLDPRPGSRRISANCRPSSRSRARPRGR